MSLNLQVKAFRHYLQKKPGMGWVLSAIWVLLIGELAFLWNLGSIGLVDETEPLFAEAARQMTVTGDWVTPYFNGETRFDKPPLIYWLMAIAYKIIGVNEWSTRLPSALAAIALMGMGFYLLYRFGGNLATDSQPVAGPYWRSALIGSACIGLSPLNLIWGRTGVSDMLLSSCIGLALMTFFCGYAVSTPSPPSSLSPWYLAFYVFIALSVLTKGPVGIVLPGLAIGLFLLYVGNFREVLREMRPLLGLLIILG
ncbi:MAG: glycosyltransferase family 39 protein, partial [Kovacikia sp.]